MANLKELRSQIENANELGVKNLEEKGVGFAGYKPTTYEIMQGIANILIENKVVVTEDAEIVAKGKTNLAQHSINLDDSATMSDVVNNILKIPPLKYAYNYVQLFNGAYFPQNTELVLEIKSGKTDLTDCFKQTKNLKKIKVIGNIENNVMCLNNFATASSNLEEIDFSDFSLNIGDMEKIVWGCGNLVKIIGEFDCTNATNAGGFTRTAKLEEIRFKKETLSLSVSFAQSKLLSSESVDSIIDGLATVETAQTLTLSSVTVLSAEQISTIESKGWTLVQ